MPGGGGSTQPQYLLLVGSGTDLGADIRYHVYKNDGAGGPVDYNTPVATTLSPTYTTPPVPPGSDVTYVVRAFDDTTGMEELNVTARYRLRTDSAGNDVTNLPRPVTSLNARPASGGGVLVTWSTLPRGPRVSQPTGFKVYAGTPTADLTAGHEVATVPSVPFQPFFGCVVTGLTAGLAYAFVVRAYNATGVEQNTASVTCVPTATGPLAVQSGGAEVVTSNLPTTGFPPLPPS